MGQQPDIKLTIRFEDGGEGWIMARVLEVPGAMSQGRTRKEARENVIDALVTVLTPDEQLRGAAVGDSDEFLSLSIA